MSSVISIFKAFKLVGIILILEKRRSDRLYNEATMLVIFWYRVFQIRNRWSDYQQTPVTLIADQRVRLCNGCASSALPDRCISLTIFDPIFDRFHITSNKVLAIRSNDILALYINKVVQSQIHRIRQFKKCRAKIIANYLPSIPGSNSN